MAEIFEIARAKQPGQEIFVTLDCVRPVILQKIIEVRTLDFYFDMDNLWLFTSLDKDTNLDFILDMDYLSIRD